MDARRVTDRSEWSALARLTPHFTHEFSWSLQCIGLIQALVFFRVPVQPTYLRVWVDDVLYGCPFLVLISADGTERALNTPRAVPARITGVGPDLDPAAVITSAWADARVDIDLDFERRITDSFTRLERDADRSSRAWALSDADLDLIRRHGDWETHWDQDQWCRSFARLWQGAWQTELVSFRRDGEPLGWAARIHRNGHEPAVVATVRSGEPVSPWVSPHLRQSSA